MYKELTKEYSLLKYLKEYMFKFVKKLFNPCHHSWKCIHTVEDIYYDEEWDKYPSDIVVTKIYQCEKCGKIKKERYVKYYD